MLKIFSKKEFFISHGFIIAGLIFLSLGIFLAFEQHFPAWIPLIGGLWTLFGGLCFTTIYLSRKLIKKDNE